MDQGEQKSGDPLNKGKDKKGKATEKKAPDEVLKEELESIRSLKLKGWVLLDFPKTLTQMKLLESSLSDFESKADIPKEDSQIVYEAWSKIVSPASIGDDLILGETRVIPSGFDGIIFLDTPSEEC